MSLLLHPPPGFGGYAPAPSVTYGWGPFRFATDEAAPMASPHTEAGAVGSMTLTDSQTKMIASGGSLTANAAVTAWAAWAWRSAAYARQAGRALLVEVAINAGNDHSITWQSAAVATQFATGPHNLMLRGSAGNNFEMRTPAVLVLGSFVPGTVYRVALVLRGTGVFYLIIGGIYTNWTLLWADNADTTATLYAGGGAIGIPIDDNIRVTDLGGAWTTDTGIATSYKATTTDADTATMTADALVFHTITAQTGVTQELRFRVTDASNYWLLRMAAPGTNTIKVIEVVAGGETERASSAQTFTNGTQYRIGVSAVGAVISPFVDNVAKTGYASAATGLTATGVYVSHAGAKLECWPRNPTLPSGV